MRLIKCRKCGATICTDETFVQCMLDRIEELGSLARKDKKNQGLYLQEAAAVKKIMTSYLHRTAQMDTDNRRVKNELSVLVGYVMENKLIPQEKLNELTQIARERAAKNDQKDAEEVEKLYGDFENMMYNRTKADPTYKKAVEVANG